MKKLLVALTMVIFVVGVALSAVPALAGPGYHQVYEYDYEAGAWVEIDPKERPCELYSQGSQHEQYRWESDGLAAVCSGPYYPPHPEDATTNNVLIKNYVHYFPWIDIDVLWNDLVWDVFKPGDYMGRAFMIALTANCPVLIHFGSGTFPVPKSFDFEPEDKDGKIVMGDLTIPDDAVNKVEDKEWQYSMLSKGSPGTPPDVIEVMYWWTEGDLDDWNDPHYKRHAVPAKDNVVLSPHGPFPTGWVRAPEMNCDYTTLVDSDDLHEGKYIIFYEDINVKDCVSEGKFFEEFVITVVPDP